MDTPWRIELLGGLRAIQGWGPAGIERSTAVWERTGAGFRSVLESHHALLRRLFREHGGIAIKELGDGFLDRYVAAARAGLTEEAFAAVRAEGQARTPNQASAYALESHVEDASGCGSRKSKGWRDLRGDVTGERSG